MRYLHDTSIRNKVLIAPIIMVMALGTVLLLALYGLNKQRCMLNQVHAIALERTALVNEFIASSEQVQSDVFRIFVLNFMKLPDKEIQPVYMRFAQGLNNMGVIYGQILTKWMLDQKEKEILAQMGIPMETFRHEAQQASDVVSQNPSIGVLLVRSAAVPFEDFRHLLTEFLNYQKEKIVHAQTISEKTSETIRITITAIALCLAFMAIIITVLIGTRFISRPIRSITDVMDQLAEGGLSVEVGGLRRRDEIGAMARAVEVFRKNAIEKALADEALRKSEEKYRGIFDESIAAIYVFDERKHFIDSNQAGLDLLGYSREELLGMSIPDVDADPAVVLTAHDQLLSGERIINYEHQLKRKDGSIITVLNNSKPLTGDEGDIIGMQSTLIDISDRKRAEEEKRKLEAQLQQAHKMEAIGTLAGGIAHDFNNILGIIIGNTELAIMDVPEWNPAKECLQEIRAASMRAKDVVRHILSFARKTPAERKPIQISTVIKDSLKLMRASIPTTIEIRRNISCTTEMIRADSTEINQVLMNLCTNALHAMEADGDVLEISLESISLDKASASQYEDLTPGDFVKLTVKDTGQGIDPEIMDRIFDPYFTTKDIGKGTGMGLSVAYGIVKKHDGAIKLRSEVGKGTVVEVLFPLIEGEGESEVIEEPQALPTGSERILFVDDEESLVKMAQQMLERLGYEVVTKTNPKEALALFKTEPDRFDLIITDMAMPQMAGDRLAQELMEIRQDIPVILCTGHSARIDEDSAKELGIKAYVMKPLAMRDLAKTVRKVLNPALSER